MAFKRLALFNHHQMRRYRFHIGSCVFNKQTTWLAFETSTSGKTPVLCGIDQREQSAGCQFGAVSSAVRKWDKRLCSFVDESGSRTRSL